MKILNEENFLILQKLLLCVRGKDRKRTNRRTSLMAAMLLEYISHNATRTVNFRKPSVMDLQDIVGVLIRRERNFPAHRFVPRDQNAAEVSI